MNRFTCFGCCSRQSSEGFPLAQEPGGHFIQLKILLFCPHEGGKTILCCRNSVVKAQFASTVHWSWFFQVEVPEASPHRILGRQSSGTSVIDGISRGIMGAGTAMIERLQAQVKQKDGEILLLQV